MWYRAESHGGGPSCSVLLSVKKGKNAKKERVVRSTENVKVMLNIFNTIERRDTQGFLELVHPDVDMHWPASLPYGGTARGLKLEEPTWSATWIPLQPSEAEQRMDPRVVAASADEVVILWRQRGITPAGDRCDEEVLGLYHVRGGKLARAQMFYFDTTALVSFLAQATGQATAPKP
jgi:ketosteroid isomerase-like protein